MAVSKQAAAKPRVTIATATAAGRSPAAKRPTSKRPTSKQAASKQAAQRQVGYYKQSTDFTCGPSSLMMAMNALDPKIKITRTLELQVWREATTIFMGDGHGGCGALGLALAAKRRGFGAEVWMNRGGTFLADRQDGRDRIAAMRLLQTADLAEAKRQHIPVHRGRTTVDDLHHAMGKGAIPLVLVSTELFHGDDGPHWVVVSGITETEILVNDPWISRGRGQTARRQTGRAISHRDFNRMTVYGPKKERATVLVRHG